MELSVPLAENWIYKHAMLYYCTNMICHGISLTGLFYKHTLSIITLGTMKGLDENKLNALPDATYPIQRQPSTKVDATQAAS